MRNILFVIAVMSCFVSCDTKIRNVKSSDDLGLTDVDHFQYNGHKYISFKFGALDCSYGGVVHDPECNCNNLIKEKL